ncbi:MAG: histidine kinase [Proteobacteria bacterium]|nr:histidine kinase [Pseudomonadota bacterium]
MIRSLRGRLFLGLAVVVVLAGMGAGALVYLWSYDEAIELQDAILQQVGALAVRDRLRPDIGVPAGVEAEDQVLIEELETVSDPQSKLHLPMLAANLPNGLQTLSRGDSQWRVLVLTRSDGSRIAVSQRTSYRDEIAHGDALRAFLPIAALIPCLMILVAVVIAHSFRPVAKLATQLNVRTSDHLAKLPLDGIPQEMRPFVWSINGLLDRIGMMFEQQRRFVADAAHELRTPITALSLHAQNLDLSVTPKGLERLAMLKTSIRRAGHLLEQLLVLARQESDSIPRALRTELDSVLKEVVADLLPQAQAKSIDLGCERIEKIEILADPTALNALFRNVVDNALRYTPEGGRVDINLSREGNHAIFRVEDTGPGISNGELARIFEPFYRGTHAKEEGSGLGLSIVRRTVDNLSGTITVENIVATDRTGLRVTVLLPLKRTAFCTRSSRKPSVIQD